MNFGDFLGQAARRHGSKTAAQQDSTSLSFTQFDDRSNQFGRLLLERGIVPGDRVAVYVGNRLEWFDAWFGTLKAGLVRVGVSHRMTSEEITHQLHDSGAKAAIVAADLEHVFREADTSELKTILVTGPDYEDALRSVSPARLNVAVSSDSPAALIYTSGTTGRPKGAVQTHRNWFAYTHGSLIDVGLDPDDRVLAAGPLIFSGACHVYSALYRGATHYVLTKFEPADVLKAIVEHGITVTTLVPTMIYMFLEELDQNSVDVSSLRTIVYGGGPMAPEKVRQCVARFGQIFVQLYGLTEVPGGVTYLRKEDHVPDRPWISSAGRAGFGVECAILDDDEQPVETGEQGEICVRGDNVASGYWNMPDATAERFRSWFHTGDLGYRDEHAFVYLVDRKSDMIVSGGHNVYPREVEDVLLAHPAVAEAAVISVLDEKWGEAVKAVVRLVDGETTSARDLANFCKERLAGYKCPKSYELSSTPLPKNANGKLLRRQLRDEYRSLADA